MHPRCGLAILLCTAFIGLNLLYQELFSLDPNLDGGPPIANTLKQVPLAEHFKGEYALRVNGSDVLTGAARVSIWSVPTGAKAVHVSTVVLSLLGSNTALGGFGAFTAGVSAKGGRGEEDGQSNSQTTLLREGLTMDVDIPVRGLDLPAAHRMTAFGVWDPSMSLVFGSSPCRLDAVVEFKNREVSGDGGSVKTLDVFSSPTHEDGPTHSSLRGASPGSGGEGEGEDATESEENGLIAQVVSLDCGLSLAITATPIDVQRIGRKVIYYALFSNILTAVQIRCYLAQMRHTEDGPSANRLSMVGIAIQALTDGYDSFLHLSLSASSQYMFNTFAIVSLFKFVLFALLEVRYLLTIWRYRHREIFAEGWDVVRRELSRVYSYFYGALIGGLMIIYNFSNYLDVIMLLLQAYWVPQILHDVRMGSKNALHPHFLVGISVTRCLGLFYLWGCPSGAPCGVFDGDIYPQLPGSPSIQLCVAAVVLQGAQVGILTSQRLLGPRWFIPWLCMPKVYNYGRAAELPENTDCVICMGELVQQDVPLLVTTPCAFSRSERRRA